MPDELFFQTVANGHQLVNPRYYSALLGERRKGQAEGTNVVEVKHWFASTISALNQFGASTGRSHETKKQPRGEICSYLSA